MTTDSARIEAMRWAVIFLSLALSSCQVLGDFSEFDSAAAPAAPTHACDSLPVAKNDPMDLAVMARVNIPNDTCFWIDRTEVTVEQYQRWQLEVQSDAITWEPDRCVWKQGREDPIGNPDDACATQLLSFDQQPFAARKPMRCVDFCEAEAFCRWADKHLCHDISGLGTQEPRGFHQEWLLTCTNQLTTRYPWGNETVASCNTGQSPEACLGVSGTCGPVVAGTESACRTPGGVQDLLGNVSEWVFSCNYVDATTELQPTGCLTRGGGYDSALEACDAETTLVNDSRLPSLGFRCCADLTSTEQVELPVDPTRR